MLGTAAGGEEEGTTANRVGQSCWWGALSGGGEHAVEVGE
jgi:hypothetical protein